jgi:hypothetical protein
MIESDDDEFNVSGDWSSVDPTTGKLSVRVDCSRWTFQTKYLANVPTGATDLAIKIEIDRYVSGSTLPQKILQDVIYARGSVGDVEGTTIPSADASANWTAPDARYAPMPTEDVTQTAHGLAAGDVIYNAAGTWTLAQADDADTLGIAIVTGVGGVNDFTYMTAGKFAYPAHGFTVGEYLFTSPSTAGELTETAPTGIDEYNNPVAFVLDDGNLLIFPMRPFPAVERSNDVRSVAIDHTDSPYTVTDLDEVVYADATGGAIVVNLPTPAAAYTDFTATVKNVGDGTYGVTVKSAGGNIDGVIGTTGAVIAVTMDARKFNCDGTNYWMI